MILVGRLGTLGYFKATALLKQRSSVSRDTASFPNLNHFAVANGDLSLASFQAEGQWSKFNHDIPQLSGGIA